jgi:hypothetical protein
MRNTEKAELTRIIAAIKKDQLPSPPVAGDFRRLPASPKRRTLASMVEPVFSKAGVDTGRVSKLLGENQKALRTAFDKDGAAAAKRSREATAAFRSGMAARLEALKLLKAPFLSSFLTLDQPFLIWQLPHPQLDIFTDSRIEPNNSSVRVLVNKNDGSNSTRFVFFFLWRNESDFFAVANVGSSLVINGRCLVFANDGILFADSATLNIAASLTLVRWSGWGADPATGHSNDQTVHPNSQSTQRQQVVSFSVDGGNIVSLGDVDGKSFSFETFPLSHSLFVIPGGASVMFQVALELSYDFDGGGNVFVDFSEDGNAVFCPNVVLEILTPLPGLAVTHTLGSVLPERR